MNDMTPRKLSAFVLAGSLLGLLACGGHGPAAQKGSDTPPPARPQTRPPAPRGDGSLSGRLTDQGTSLALADAIVYIHDARKPRVLAKGVTGADGSFTLKDLPLGVPVRVVTQPVAGSLTYAATLSQPVTLVKDTPAPAVNLACAQVAQAGHVELARAPRQVQATEIALVQKKDTGGGSAQLALRSGHGVLARIEFTGRQLPKELACGVAVLAFHHDPRIALAFGVVHGQNHHAAVMVDNVAFAGAAAGLKQLVVHHTE